MGAWSRFGAAALDLFMPAVCPACRRADGPGLCLDCLARIPLLDAPCPRCGTPGAVAEAVCRHCAGEGLPHLRAVVVAHPYRGVIKDLIGDAKAAGRPAAVRVLAGLMPVPPAGLPVPPVVVPIPPARGRRPGPHLATALARAVARRHHLAFRRLLRATRLAAEQHRLGVADRRANVEGLFVCRGEAPAQVLLVDDLLTSGATASAAAAALQDAGARQVILLCLARTPRRGESPDDARHEA